MLKGQSAKCDEGPIRIIAENFRHFEEGGHSCCAKFFLHVWLIILIIMVLFKHHSHCLLALKFWISVASCDICLETWWCSTRAYGCLDLSRA